MTPPAVRVSNVTKFLARRRVLDGISLDVGRGEIVDGDSGPLRARRLS